MKRALAPAACVLLALACVPAPALAATGWSDPELITAPPTAIGGTVATDQAADGAGNVHVAYQQCGEPMGAFSAGCSLRLVTRSAATGDWTEPTTVAPVVGYVDGPSSIDVDANAAGDVVVGWETCSYGSSACAPQVAMRPRDNDAWTPPTLVVPGDLTHDGDDNFALDVALAADGGFTVAWNRRHRHEGNVTSVEVLARSGAVADAGVENPVLAFGAVATVAPSTSTNDRTAAPVVVTTDEGTTVAAWWYQGGGACHLIRYAVRSAGGAWAAQQGLGGLDCATALRFDTPEYALAAAGNDAVLVYAGGLLDETGATTGDAGTWATTIDGAGTLGATTRLSDGLFGLTADPTAGGGDLTRAQFARNAAGELVLAANEQGEESSDRPVVVVRDAGGDWGPVVPADGSTPVNGGLGNPAPGVAIDGAGTVTLAWSINVAVATPEDPWASDLAIRAAQLPRGATAFGTPSRLSAPGQTSTRPLVSSAAAGLPVVTWRQNDPENGQAGIHTAQRSTAPQASFTWAPAAPVAGETVTFTSTSTDPDGPISAWSWDLNDDGTFGDRAGASAQAVFEAAGDYTVTLRVTDGDDQVDYAVNVVVVERGSVSDPVPGPSVEPGHDPGTGSPPSGPPVVVPAPMTVPPPHPSGFVGSSVVDTTATRPMPTVAGRSLDDARGLVVRSLVHADIATAQLTADSAKLGKRPGGGKWKLGDIVTQTPAAGSQHLGSISRPTAVKLTYWAGAKSDQKKCDALRSTVKGDDLDLALAQLRAAKCGTPDLKLKASKSAGEPNVKSLSKDRDDLTVNVPTDQSKLDIVIWKNTGFLGTNDPGPVPSEQGDLQLTAGQQNVAGVILRDRAGQPLNRASVTWDLTGVGGTQKTTKSIESGVAPVKLTPDKPGTVRVLVSWSDSVGETIYGYTEFKVVDRSKDAGFITAIGQSFKRSGSGPAAVFQPGSFKGAKASAPGARASGSGAMGRRAGIGDFFNVLAAAIRSWGGPIAAAVNGTAEGILGVAKTFQTSVAQLWRGPVDGPPTAAAPSFTRSGIWMVMPNGVVAAGGANVVAAGGMNVIAAGGGNVVAAGGMNVIAAGGGNVVSAGGGNIITLPDGARVVAAGGGNVVAAGGMNVIAAGGGNVVAAGGLN